jgi:tRNA(adenine34) deaminase
VFGAYDPKAGAFGSVYDLSEGKLNHKPEITGGVLKDECSQMLKVYFQGKRS